VHYPDLQRGRPAWPVWLCYGFHCLSFIYSFVLRAGRGKRY
jgi:hypothetical protein